MAAKPDSVSGTASEPVQATSGHERRTGPIVIRPNGPFDLKLSLAAEQSFLPISGSPPPRLRTAVEIAGHKALVEVSQSPASGLLYARSAPCVPRDVLRSLVKWLVSQELDLRAFYSSMANHPVMSAVVRSLPGLKPLRPATLFEMVVIAITEQQLSLAAAFHIRDRLVARHGIPFGDARVFPTASTLAGAATEDLSACGLSRRKAEYLKSLAAGIAAGGFDFETLRGESDERIREILRQNRGLGEWSVEYILARAFGRPDSLPAGDTGLRRVVGYYLAEQEHLTSAELQQALAPFRPYRGLAAFYLAVHWRLRRNGAKPPSRKGDSAGRVQESDTPDADLP